MSVTFHLPSDRPIGLVQLTWSPLFEAALSLRAALHPKRSPLHLPWVRRFQELDAELRDELQALFGAFGTYVPGVFEVGLCGRIPDFDVELRAFRELDPTVAGDEFANALAEIPCNESFSVADGAAELRARVATRTDVDGLPSLVDEALERPAALLDRYAVALERYWDAAFREEWERLAPRLEREVTDGARALVTGGVAGLVDELLPEATWDPESLVLSLQKDWDGEADVAERGGLVLVPTVFGWPTVLVELYEPWPLAVFFPVRDLRSPQVPLATDREVAAGLKALADETRLQITRLVAEEERSTRELAELLSLSDSAISRHLKLLESAGLVESRRDGYFVLYRLVPDRIDALGYTLRSALGLAGGGSGAVPALPVAVSRANTG